MTPVPDLSVKVLAGAQIGALRREPLRPYAPDVIAFLGDLSKVLLSNPDIGGLPDVATFAYWCRASNLSRLARGLDISHQRVGRGLVLHIAPANVPVNFAFSWAFGLLAGNSNIVRIPEAQTNQVDVICNAIGSLFDTPKHLHIAQMNSLVRYPRSDAITTELSAIANARILWGGDQTIAHLRKLATSARCLDIPFADRYSICVMNVDAVIDSTDQVLERLALGFYNDTYLMDQNACSSPHLVIWQGLPDRAEQAMRRFWAALDIVLKEKYQVQPIHAIDKFVHLCRSAVRGPISEGVVRSDNRTYRIRLAQIDAGIDEFRGKNGYFYEHVSTDLACLKGVVNEKYQTLTCFGLDREQLARFVVDQAFRGIDRVVPVGQALDISVIWDGIDLIPMLSRIVHTL